MGLHFLPMVIGGYTLKHAEAYVLQKRSDIIIAESNWSAGQWRRFGVSPERLRVVPYAVDLDMFRPRPFPMKKPEDEFLFLHIGRIVPRKRVDLLLEAFPLVAQAEPRTKLLMVGHNLVPWISTKLQHLNSGSAIEYRTTVDHHEVPELIARANCIIQPSENENFGSAVAEGMACGRPVLVGPTNGTKDFIPQGSVVFDEYTPQALAQGMLTVIRNSRSKWTDIAARNRQAAELAFRPDVVADELERIIWQARLHSKSNVATREGR
jgi:glycosyltransferase involved in cell wall biosynthesis